MKKLIFLFWLFFSISSVSAFDIWVTTIDNTDYSIEYTLWNVKIYDNGSLIESISSSRLDWTPIEALIQHGANRTFVWLSDISSVYREWSSDINTDYHNSFYVNTSTNEEFMQISSNPSNNHLRFYWTSFSWFWQPTWTQYITDSDNRFFVINNTVYPLSNPSVSCNIITEQKLLFNNFSVDVIWDIQESWLNTAWIYNHNYINTSSGSTISLYNIQDLNNFPNWLLSTWTGITFKSDYFLIWENPSIYISNPLWITYINIESDNTFIWDIKLFDSSWNEYDEILWSSLLFNSWLFLDSKAYSVIISFEKSLFTRSINSIDFWVELITSVSSELCYNSDDDEYELDWDIYSGPIDWLDSSTGSVVPVSEWSYTTSWYSFFENWFILHNFLPNPYGWELSFDIISPWSDIPVRTEKFWSYEVDWLWYWFDSWVKITYPYHEIAWDYKVRVVYEYWGQVVFPFWDSYNNYNISLPEVRWADPDDILPWDYQSCNDWNQDDWFLPWVSNFFLCASESVGWFFSSMRSFVGDVTWLFRAIWNLWNTDERKTLDQAFNWLIPSANAQTYVYNENQDVLKIVWSWTFEDMPILNNIYNLIKFAIMGYILFWIFVFLFPNKNNDV